MSNDTVTTHCEQRLMAAAVAPGSPDTRLFARLLAPREAHAEFALLGLSAHALSRLLQRHFGTAPPAWQAWIASPSSSPVRHDFADGMQSMLRSEVDPARDIEDAACVVAIVAAACLRPDHLWRDLGLSGRDDVTQLLTRYFPALVARNDAGLRWKKFLALEYARYWGLVAAPSPGCPGCEDFDHCYAPGDALREVFLKRRV